MRLAAEVLKKEGYFSRISENDIQQGLNAEAPCRMQVMNSSGKEFILDVGHNPPALVLPTLLRDLSLTVSDIEADTTSSCTGPVQQRTAKKALRK